MTNPANTMPAASLPSKASRIAVNPIPYWSRDGVNDKSVPVFERAFADLSAIGFKAVKADIPEGMAAGDYVSWLGGYGLRPSLSLFNSAFDETVDMSAELERAKSFAAGQLALGLDRTMVSSVELPVRRRVPAVGAGFSQARLEMAIENAGQVCLVLQSEGLRPLHHSHVGGVFETEAEITALLDTLGADVIGFGPDTGHLKWAGMDPAEMIRRYADRLGGIHLKDVYGDYLSAGSRRGMSYFETTATQRMWAEPGLGVLDMDGILAAIPESYDGDFMIEVDRPSVDSLYECHEIAFGWAQSQLGSA